MKQLLFTLLVFTSLHSSAQQLSKGKAVKYNTRHAIDSQELENGGTVYLYESKPEDIHFIGQLGTTADFASNDLLKVSLRADVDVFFKKGFSLSGSYSYALMDLSRQYSHSNTNHSENETMIPTSMELGGRIVFRKSTRDVKHMVILESKRVSSRTTVNYYIKPKLPSLNMMAVRAGFIGYNTVVSTDMNDKVLSKEGHGVVMAKDGTALTDNYFTSAFFRGGYLGFSSMRMINCMTKNTLKKGSFFRTKYIREYYADILFAGAAFDPIIDGGISRELATDAAGSFHTSKIGARIGVAGTRFSEGISRGGRIEAGYRPDLKGGGWYVLIGGSINLVK